MICGLRYLLLLLLGVVLPLLWLQVVGHAHNCAAACWMVRLFGYAATARGAA